MPPSNRERILEGAIECVQTIGVAATTTRDIAAAAKASLASIPYHFGSKDALMDEALETALDRYSDHLRDVAFAEGDDPVSHFSRSIEALLGSFSTARPLISSLVEAWARSVRTPGMHRTVRRKRRDAVKRIAAMIEESLGEAAANVDTTTLANVFLSLVDGLMVQSLVDPEGTPSAAAVLDALALMGTLGIARREVAPPVV